MIQRSQHVTPAHPTASPLSPKRHAAAVRGKLLGVAFGAVMWLAGCAAQNPFSAYSPAGAQKADEARVVEASNNRDPRRAAQLRTDLATDYFARGQMQAAQREIDAALKADARFAPALGMQGLIQAQLGEPTKAEASFRAALAAAPGDADTLHNYGVFLCSQKRYPEALAQFSTALAQPNYRNAGRTWLAYGTCQKSADQLQPALQSLSQAATMMPGDLNTAYELADTLHVLGRDNEARSWVAGINAREATASPASLELESRIAFALGDRNAALSLLRQLRARFPDSPEALRYR